MPKGDLGKFKITAGAQTLDSGYISASVDEDSPMGSGGDINVINCYTNCIDENWAENEAICEVNFDGLEQDEPEQNDPVQKNAFDHEIDPLQGLIPDYWQPMREQCDKLSDEEYEMFNYKEYRKGFF